MTIGVYRITNIITDDFYLGSSNDIERRWSQHQHDLSRGIHYNQHLQRAWDKYSKTAFSFDLIQECTDDNLRQVEQDFLDSLHPPYNLSSSASSPPGTKGLVWSEEARLHLSIAMTKRDASPEFRLVKSRARRDSWTIEERQKKSRESAQALKEMWGDPKKRNHLLAHTQTLIFRKSKSEWMKELNQRQWGPDGSRREKK